MGLSGLFSLRSSEHFADVISCVLPRPGRAERGPWAEGDRRASREQTLGLDTSPSPSGPSSALCPWSGRGRGGGMPLVPLAQLWEQSPGTTPEEVHAGLPP